MTSINHFLGKVVLADLGRGDDLTLETRSGSRILVNRHEARSIRELTCGPKLHNIPK
jgi:hypothetical protein